jgi:hypothetical protein
MERRVRYNWLQIIKRSFLMIQPFQGCADISFAFRGLHTRLFKLNPYQGFSTHQVRRT